MVGLHILDRGRGHQVLLVHRDLLGHMVVVQVALAAQVHMEDMAHAAVAAVVVVVGLEMAIHRKVGVLTRESEKEALHLAMDVQVH